MSWETMEGQYPDSDRICFASGKTLGKLAKWLRIMGFDTLYDSGVSAEHWAAAPGERRTVLTRTRRVVQNHPGQKIVMIHSDRVADQLQEVVDHLGLDHRDVNLFSICLLCNQPIRCVDKLSVRGRVPDFVWETTAVFKWCCTCNKIYWPGTHTTRSRMVIDNLFA